MIRALSCSDRGLLACAIIFPKFELVMLVAGAGNVTRLNTLNASAWNANLIFSWIGKIRRKLTSWPYAPGLSTPYAPVRGVIPYVKGAGETKAFLSRNAVDSVPADRPSRSRR